MVSGVLFSHASKMNRQGQSKRDFMIEVWEELDCESVGSAELEEIQQRLRNTFGNGVVEAPAAIARVLADEGAVLRHPEVIECDVKWRHARIEQALNDELDLANLTSAGEKLVQVVKRWSAADPNERQWLRERVNAWRREAELLAASVVIDEADKAIAAEIASWTSIWLQNPIMFEDWISLRIRAREFVGKFGDVSVASMS